MNSGWKLGKMNYRKSKIILSFALLMLLVGAFAGRLSAQGKTAVKSRSKPLPDLVLNTVDGQKWSLSERRGHVILLNFWATWCAPCRTEIPQLVRLSDKYKKSGLEVVGISVDSENIAGIKAFIEDYKINYPTLLAVPGSLLSQQKAVPMTMLIDEKGVLSKKYVGAVREAVFEKDIKKLLGKPKS